MTPRLLVPLTVAVRVVDCPPVSEAVAGVTIIETGVLGGTNDTIALALLVASAALVAFTVTVCAEAMVAGAV